MANSRVALLRHIRIARGWRRVRVEAIRRGRGWDELLDAAEGIEILERGHDVSGRSRIPHEGHHLSFM
jgi:hypothetical protein